MWNLSIQPVSISTRTILCELQPVAVALEIFEKIKETHAADEILETLNIDEANVLDPTQKEKLIDY